MLIDTNEKLENDRIIKSWLLAIMDVTFFITIGYGLDFKNVHKKQ